MIETLRLKLLPSTVPLARAELGDRSEFARLLGASVPENWPPESLLDALPLFLAGLETGPDRVGWFSWYGLAAGNDAGSRMLVSSGGFSGLPHEGTVELWYSVLPQFQGMGYATEMVIGLTTWAMGQSGVRRVVAETEWENPASVRVLSKAGFTASGPSTGSGGMRFERIKLV
ncbi:MAG: GNAT family N-acetyltransferase [Candidatus Latescibacteria bacterium]|nr:GNAT family N-acetyltransferase [Candidatus Latescibacterota bacterium]